MSDTTTTASAPKVNKFARAPKVQEDPLLKSVKVKTGTLKRNVKDLGFANAEVAREEARLEKITVEDPEKIQQQNNVIKESKMMIPLAENRIRTSLQELKDLLADNEVSDNELKDAALAAIAEAEILFPSE
jgi:tubulin-specific chaperone A